MNLIIHDDIIRPRTVVTESEMEAVKMWTDYLATDIEIWRDIKGYEGFYQVSNFGRVRSSRFGRLRVLGFSYTRGYQKVNVCTNGVRRMFAVHRLVAEAFLTNHKGKRVVNHIDHNRANNHYSNLEYMTDKENSLHAHFDGEWFGEKWVPYEKRKRINV